MKNDFRGISHQIEEVLKSLIRILGTQEPRRKDATIADIKDRVMTLNTSQSKKKYNTLVVLLDHLDVEKLLAENTVKNIKMIF